MTAGRLGPLQERLLQLLSELRPPFRLIGGAALIGFVTAHRTTRDLDLVWYGTAALDSLVKQAEGLMIRAGLEVRSIQSSPSFHRFQVDDGSDSLLVDLVADPGAPLEPSRTVPLGRTTIDVDSPFELLVTKLCTLLERSEVRDLEDVKALLDTGLDLRTAVENAPRRDGGFSPLTLAWVLRDLPLTRIAAAADHDAARIEELERFRTHLVDDLLAWAGTESAPDNGA